MAILAPEDMGRKLPPVGSPVLSCQIPQQFYAGLRASMPASTLFSIASKRFVAADREAAILAGCLVPTGGAAGGAGPITPGGGTMPPVAIPKLPTIPVVKPIPPPPPGALPKIPKLPSLPSLPPLPPPPLSGAGGGGGMPSPAAIAPAAGGAGVLILIALALLGLRRSR